MRRALARVNLAAVERNCSRLARELTGGAELCAVVKADAYGHGMLPCARAALSAGASWLAVATADEAARLRDAGVDARLLVMGAVSEEELPAALESGADLVAWDERFVELLDALGATVRVHVKLDSGMGRLGTRDPEQADRVLAAIDAAPSLEAAGLMTHFATADALGDAFFGEQLERFRMWAGPIGEARPELVIHAANSPATLRDAASHFGLVRCGVAVYGMDPFGEDPIARELEPALELRTYVAAVKRCAPGQSVGYGRRFVADRETFIATLPIGYGDGYRRAFTNNADVLVGGRRFPLVGAVSMDNVAIDLGPSPAVEDGAPAILIGADGDERVSAEELAARIDTINYEVTCGLSARVPRVYHRDGAPVA